MAVVVVRDPAVADSRGVDDVLAAAGLAVRHSEAGAPPVTGLDGVDGVIVLSAPTSPAAGEGALLRAALAADVPVLALGPGAARLADPSGHGTGTGAGTETGTETGTGKGLGVSPARGPVTLTTSADRDPLLAGSGPLPAFGPAADSFTGFAGPPGAVALATCTGSAPQAFRLGSSAWGIRFLTPTRLGPWGEALLRRFAALVAARAEHTATRAFFTGRADAWEERFAHQNPAYAAAVARMRVAPGGLLLDLGCGTGRAMPALSEQAGPGGRVLGIDVTQAMLASAARYGRGNHGLLLAADCNRLPLPGRSVRGIFSAGLLDHLPAPGAALVEWARVGAPGAVLLLFHPSGRAERAARHGRPLDPGDLLAEDNLRPALAAAGWRLDEYEDAAGHFLARARLSG
ncbi:methyltransferase domain-containing protein [Streptomyces sp. NPDC090025]|uniref:methyltransferase domain-containing protein n=1 Tax=Streptomyces sp. NPDC090025 TaxID=3365922 RepID=UPI0038365B37